MNKKEFEYSNYKCPKCGQYVTVRLRERDVTKIWCGGINCAFYFTPLSKILTERESRKLPVSYKLIDIFK